MLVECFVFMGMDGICCVELGWIWLWVGFVCDYEEIVMMIDIVVVS